LPLDKINLISDKARIQGKEVHKLFEDILNNKLNIDIPLKYNKIASSFKDYLKKQVDLKVLGTEVPVFHERYGYAGTVDAIVSNNGNIEIWDYKTSKKRLHSGRLVHKVTEKMGWQLGGYKLAVEDYKVLGIDKVDGMKIINCNPLIGTVKETTYVHFDFCVNAFLQALNTYKWHYFNLLSKKGLKDFKTGKVYKWEIEDLLFDTSKDFMLR